MSTLGFAKEFSNDQTYKVNFVGLQVESWHLNFKSSQFKPFTIIQVVHQSVWAKIKPQHTDQGKAKTIIVKWIFQKSATFFAFKMSTNLFSSPTFPFGLHFQIKIKGLHWVLILFPYFLCGCTGWSVCILTVVRPTRVYPASDQQ